MLNNFFQNRLGSSRILWMNYVSRANFIKIRPGDATHPLPIIKSSSNPMVVFCHIVEYLFNRFPDDLKEFRRKPFEIRERPFVSTIVLTLY
jgi:hypothetical protein